MASVLNELWAALGKAAAGRLKAPLSVIRASLTCMPSECVICRQDSCRQVQGSTGSPESPCQACWPCGSPPLPRPSKSSASCAGPAARAAAAGWTDHLEGVGPGRQSMEDCPAPRWLACCHASRGRAGGGLQACGCCRRWGQAHSKQSSIAPAATVRPNIAARSLGYRLHSENGLHRKHELP